MQRKLLIGNLTAFYCVVIGLMLTGILVGNKTVAVLSQTIPVPRQYCFVIDAGHGGEDGGTVSPEGKTESSYNLEIALRLRDLMHLLGFRTKMIRTEDCSVSTTGTTISQRKVSDLKNRVKMTESVVGSPILLSIHQNFYGDSRYSGAQVFYGSSTESRFLAEAIQNKLVRTLNPGSRRMTKEGQQIYLLETIRCPGVLIECGFLSNPQEAQMLTTENYQKKLAAVIAAGVCDYLCKSDGSVV